MHNLLKLLLLLDNYFRSVSLNRSDQTMFLEKLLEQLQSIEYQCSV